MTDVSTALNAMADVLAQAILRTEAQKAQLAANEMRHQELDELIRGHTAQAQLSSAMLTKLATGTYS